MNNPPHLRNPPAAIDHQKTRRFDRGATAELRGIWKDTRGFEFNDGTGLLKWVAADRAVVTIQDMKDLTSKQVALVKVVGGWIEATM